MLKKLLIFPALVISATNFLMGQEATFPFEIYDHRIHIDLQLNDKSKLDFMFDTGAESSVIDQSIAKKAGIKAKGSVVITGAAGKESLKYSGKQKITIADQLKIKGVRLIFTDLMGWRERTGRQFDGIIGYDILQKYVTSINYDHKTISLYHKIEDVDLSGYESIKFDFHNKIAIPQFEITITLKNGKRFQGIILFDTGAGLTLSLNRPFVMENNIYNEIGNTIASRGGGLNKQHTYQTGLIAEMSIGNFTLGEMPVQMSESEEGVTSYEGYLGLLGNEVISKFNVVLDYKNRKLYLKPNDQHTQKFNIPLSGIKLKKREDKIIIDQILKNSNSYKMGLRAGDHVISVKGNHSNDLFTYKQLLDEKEGVLVIEIQKENGNILPIEITLERLL